MAWSSSNTEDFTSAKLFDVSHVTALVTGGGSGIGLMITQALVANGAKVYITGRREEVLEKVVELYSKGPGQILPLPADISSKESIQKLASEMAKKEPNGIQLLVNNAGIARDDKTKFSSAGEPDLTSPQAISDHFMKSEFESWEDTFRTNVTAGFFMSMAFVPLLAKGQEQTREALGYTSSIVNVTSISGAMKGSSMGQFAYSSSKAAFTHVTRMLATTLKETGIRVNCIAPGIFPSEMTAGESDENQKTQMSMKAGNPAGRKGHDSDMAATILMLAGRGGVFYNEQIMYPDGGATLAQPATN